MPVYQVLTAGLACCIVVALWIVGFGVNTFDVGGRKVSIVRPALDSDYLYALAAGLILLIVYAVFWRRKIDVFLASAATVALALVKAVEMAVSDPFVNRTATAVLVVWCCYAIAKFARLVAYLWSEMSPALRAAGARRRTARETYGGYGGRRRR